MHGNVTDEEWRMFRDVYQFFAAHCLPPANQDKDAAAWWTAAAAEVGILDQKWKGHPLPRGLLLAIYDVLDWKAKEKTREEAQFVQK